MSHRYESRWLSKDDEYPRSEKVIDTTNALYAIPKAVRRRVLEQDRRRFVAFDAHSLLAEGDVGRPGHPYD